MGVYSDAALVLNSRGLECFNAQLENIEKDMRNDILEFLGWADEEAESQNEWLLCWRDIKWYCDDAIDMFMGILNSMPEAYYKFRRVEETGDTDYMGDLYGDFNIISVHRLEWKDMTAKPAVAQTYSLRPPVITSEDVADMLGMTVAQAEEFLLDNSTRIIQRMMASAWSAIADIKRSM